jgi:hypothetical protein
MKKFLTILTILVLLISCVPSETPQTGDVQGRAFKGPFLPSSSVDLYVLDSDLNQTGLTFSGTVTDESGAYYIANVPVDGAVELIVEGYFFNEVSGQLSNDKITLKALTEQTGTINVNLFTTISMRRVRHLVSTGMSVQGAKEQALQELASHFHWTMTGTADAIELESENGKKILAFSSMIADGRNSAEIGELITRLTTDFADGTFTEENMTELLNSCFEFDPTDTRYNLQGYFDEEGINITVPFFADAINEFLLYDKPTDYIYAISEHYVTLEPIAETIARRTNTGYTDEFWLSPTAEMSVTVNDPDGYIHIYGSDGVEVNGNTVSSISDGIVKFEIFPISAPTGYEYSFDITVNGETHTNNFIIID